MAGFLGMRGTGDWVTDQRPKNWREGILYLYPNGTASLTAILSKMKSESTDDPEFNWWTKTLPTQRATLTGKYTNILLSTAYVSGGVAGDTIYGKMTEAHADQFRVGHQVLFRDASHWDVDCNAKVTAVVKAGASSYVACKLLEADNNGASTDISDADTLLIVGSINAEGASMPDAVSYDSVKLTNYTQIFRTPLSITRTARKTKLRTGDAYQEMKREALELHSIEMEKAFLFGVSSEGIGSNGKPERTTQGIIPTAIASGTSDDFSLNTDYSADTWLASGEDWLDEKLEIMFRYGSREKLALCGSGSLLGIQRLIKNKGNFEFHAKTMDYGIQVIKWTTVFGVINIVTHPLFSYEATNRNSMLVLEPANIRYRYVDDTKFYAEGEMQNTGRARTDSTEEEFLTEAGLEYHHPISWGYLNGFNTDNSV